MKKNSSNSVLNIKVKQEDKTSTLVLEGRLDTLTAPELEEKVEDIIDSTEKLIFDLEQLEYISSAGLRVLLGAVQEMEDKGEMIIRHPSKSVREVFDLTGFSRLFTIE